MKRNALTVTLLLAVSLAVFTQLNCATSPDTNRSAPTVTSAPTPEPVNTAAIETELLRIENDWPRVIKERDVEAVRRVEADDAIFVYPDGTVGSKAQDIRDIESGALSADSWEVIDLKVKVLDNDAALVSGGSIVKGGKFKGPDGKVIDISGQYRFIDTFARRDGQWKLVAGASVQVRNPAATASPTPTPRSTPTPRTTPTPRSTPTPRATPASSPRPTS